MSHNNDEHKEQRIGLWLAGGAATLSVLVILFYAIWGWETGNIEGAPNYGNTAASAVENTMAASEVAASELAASAASTSETLASTASAPAQPTAASAPQTAVPTEATAATASATEKAASAPAVPATEASASAPVATPASAPQHAASAPSPATTILADHAPADANTAQVVIADNGVVKFYFAIGKADLAKGAPEALKDVLAGVKAGKKVVISGFHDSTGNAAQNEELSKQRAFAVRNALLQAGVPESKIELRKPANTEAGKGTEARRVEVVLE